MAKISRVLASRLVRSCFVVTALSGLIASMVTLPFPGGSTSDLWAFAALPFALACVHPKV